MQRDAIVLTGAGGFIGRDLLREFRGFAPLYALTRSPHGQEQREQEPYTHWIQGDLSEDQAAGRLARLAGPCRWMIHAAGQAHIPQTRANREKFVLNNIKSTEQALEWAKRCGIEHFVFVSSIAAENGSAHDIYAESKRTAELKVAAFCSDAGMSYTIVRPVVVYGEHDVKGNFHRLIGQISKGWMPLFREGKALKPILYVRNLSACIREIVEHRLHPDSTVELYDDTPMTIYQICEAIRQAAGTECRYISIPTGVVTATERVLNGMGSFWGVARSWHQKIVRLDGSREESRIDRAADRDVSNAFKMPYSSTDGIRRTVAWHTKTFGNFSR